MFSGNIAGARGRHAFCGVVTAATLRLAIGRAAREIAHADYGWDQLVAQLRPGVRV